MKIELNISEDRTAYTISVDGGPAVPMDNFLLLTREGEKTRNLVFGSVENIGRLVYGFYVNCWRFEETGMREVLEVVADDIRDRRQQSTEEAIRKAM